MTGAAFRHVDGEQTIVFGDDALRASSDLIGEGYTLLSTARAIEAAPALKAAAATVVEVPAGAVDEVAAGVLDRVGSADIVALGGGRVIDTAKAVAAAKRLRGPVAVPTSLSGAEMTGVHRHAKGVSDDTPRVRARVVINTPALSASQPVEQLAASSANALGHAITALTSTGSSVIARAVGREATSRIRGAWATDRPNRNELALGALLAGWAVDRSGLGPHHALSQTAVRIGNLAHADVNAALLPHTIKATRDRAPDTIDVTLVTLAENLRDRAGVTAIGPFADNNEMLDRAVQIASRRSELERVPPALTAPEIREIYLAAR